MIECKDREETIRLTAEFLEISEIEATFIWGQEHGEIEGDVILVMGTDTMSEHAERAVSP